MLLELIPGYELIVSADAAGGVLEASHPVAVVQVGQHALLLRAQGQV